VDSESDDIIDLDEILDNATLQTSSQIPSDVDYDTPTTSRYQGKGKRLSSNPKKSHYRINSQKQEPGKKKRAGLFAYLIFLFFNA
jgi:hypothetical protein